MPFANFLNRFLDDDKVMQRTFSIALFIANITYAIYLLSLGFYNRLAADDYNYLAEFQEHGFASPAAWYVKWQGRFTAQTLINVAFALKNIFHSLLPYTLLLSALYIYSIRKILQVYLDRLGLKQYFSGFLLFNISLFIFQVFVVSNFAFNTFFWINVSAMYFGGIAFALLGFSELIAPSRKIISYIIIFISFLFVGASAEHHGAIACLFLGLSLLYLLWKHWPADGFKVFHIAIFQKILLALTVCFIAFLIMILAPGNNIRRAYFPETSIADTFLISARSTAILLLHYIPSKIKFLFLLGLPMVYFGTLARKEILKDADKTLAKYLLLALPVLIIFLWIFLLPNAYAQGEMGPMRARRYG